MLSEQLIVLINQMKHSPAHNYVIPGLTSWLIGQPSKKRGCVRMFTMSRDHEENILPHSHRFDFRCVVMRGKVTNNVWRWAPVHDGDLYAVSDVTFEGELGKHQRTEVARRCYARHSETFSAGEEYSMKAEEFHSIEFSRGSQVLFFEGPNRLEVSQVLEPVVDNERIPLFKTDEWMFRKEPK